MAVLAAVCVSVLWVSLFLPPDADAFKPLLSPGGGSITHRDITQRAVLRKTAQVCRDQAAAQGRDFSLPIDDSLSVFALQRACSNGPSAFLSSVAFKAAIVKIYLSNAAVDVLHAFSAKHHFDDESFAGGRDIITQGVASVKASVRQESFISARISLGAVCHTLQDFYSHSNWVEMGNTAPFTSLIRPDLPLDNLAGPDTATCRSCTAAECTDNILPGLLQGQKLTSGYFNLISSTKPAGKCSHGGSFDQTRFSKPVGGINKDDAAASHGHLHHRAADVALNATMELLQDLRLATGDKAFLRLMGITQSSVLCFVIDTTGSMSDDIAEAKRVSFFIIDSKRGTLQEPSEYILVPFNDPDFGPLIRTDDADVFKQSIGILTASGGGDLPEMSMSALQLALTAAPPSTDIFVFTDAAAKDSELKSTVQALIESTQSKVTFLLTGPTRSARRRRRNGGFFGEQGGAGYFGDQTTVQRLSTRRMSDADAQLYRDLAQTSGGQAIEVTKATLSQATVVIEDASTSSLVTLLQAVGTPVMAHNCSFMLDESVSNTTVYITGNSVTFTLYSPSGVSQSHSVAAGPLGTIQRVGNLCRVLLNTLNQTGLWEINIDSTETYTVKVIGQSSIDFLYNFVEANEGIHGDYGLKEGRPFTGASASLLLSVMGGDVRVTEVSLVEVSGAGAVNGTVESVGGGDFLVTMDRVPDGEFVVRLKGEKSGSSRSSHNRFQRQSSTQIRASRVTVTAQPNSTLEPGMPFTIPFTVATNATGGSYTIRARNDRGFNTSFVSSLTLETGGRAQSSVTLTAPSGTPSGTDVTLTLEAEAPGASDSNYVVLRLAVVAEVTDFSRPVCQVISVSASCPANCSLATWHLSANLTDGNGTGIERVAVQRGSGSLNVTTVVGEGGNNVTLASYSASCCSEEVELVAADAVGNVGTCFASIRGLSSDATTTTATATGTARNDTLTPMPGTSSSGGRSPGLPFSLWFGAAVLSLTLTPLLQG